jgi:hypothetical protein
MFITTMITNMMMATTTTKNEIIDHSKPLP